MQELQPFVNVVYQSPVTPETALINQKVADVLRSLNEIQVGMGATSFHVDRSGGWAGADRFSDAPFSFNMAGDVIVNSILINGLDGSVIAGAIDEDGNFVNNIISTNLDTQAKEILGEFTFQGSGAIAMKTDANNGLWLSPTGILGKKAGSTTFAIDTGGNATFGGTLVAASGTFGTVTAGTLVGATFRTATPGSGVGSSVEMVGGSSQGINFYYDETLRATIKGYTTEGSEVTYLHLEAASGRELKFKNSFISCNGNFNPSTDEGSSLGTAGTKWDEVRGNRLYQQDSNDGNTANVYDFAYIEMGLVSEKLIKLWRKDRNGDNMQRVDGRPDRDDVRLPFAIGTVLKWGRSGLEENEKESDFAIAIGSDRGMPIVLGAEPVRMIGKVKIGDFAVPSNVKGVAKAISPKEFKTWEHEVIGRCLKTNNKESEKLVKVMIKF